MVAEVPALEIRNLRVTVATPDGPAPLVRGVSLTLGEGRVLGIVGESGSGKTATALTILGLHPPGVTVTGSVRHRGRELLGLAAPELRRLRGSRVAMIFEDPASALNPAITVGRQIAEGLRIHQPDLARGDARRRAVALLDLVGMPQPERTADAFPFELSGGMCQRAMIAMAISNDPDVLIADEPTTGLDVTVQAQVLDLLRRVRAEKGMAMILISHDLGVIAASADEVAVMYAGEVVERGPVEEVFHRSRHPYTRALLAACPRVDGARLSRARAIGGKPPSPVDIPPGCPFHPRCGHAGPGCGTAVVALRPVGAVESACVLAESLADGPSPRPGPRADAVTTEVAATPVGEPVLEVRDLVKEYPVPGTGLRRAAGWIQAVDGVSFDLGSGETLALVGESGCGKSTIARCLLRLVEPTEGEVILRGQDVLGMGRRELRRARRSMQVVFQDSSSTLDPRMTAATTVAEPLRATGTTAPAARSRSAELFGLVGLGPETADRYPHQLSSGERQRVGLARALALDPTVLLLDEPVSALDVSVQAGVLELLEQLQHDLGLSYLFIAHDLAVVSTIADRVAVMYLGRVVEIGPRDDVYRRPAHPYTVALLSAVPHPDPELERARRRIVLGGELPDPAAPPTGCPFRTRCWKATDLCVDETPALVDRGQGHPVRCHFPE